MGGQGSRTPDLEAGPPTPAVWPTGSPGTLRCWGPCGQHTQGLAGMLSEWGGPARAVFGRRGPCVRLGSWGPQHRGVGPGPGALTGAPTTTWGLDRSAACSPHSAGHPGPGAGRPSVQGERAGGGGGVPGQSPRGADPGPAILTAASSDFPPVSSGCSCGHRKTRCTGPSVPPDPGWACAGLPTPFGPWHPHLACGAALGPREGRLQHGPGCIQRQPPSLGLRQPRARPPLAFQGPGQPLSPWSGKSRSPAEGRAFSVTAETRELGQRSRGSHQAPGTHSRLVPGWPGVHTPPPPPPTAAVQPLTHTLIHHTAGGALTPRAWRSEAGGSRRR